MSRTEKGRLATAIRLFVRVHHLHRCVFDRLVSGFGLHRSQHQLLMDIARADTPLSQKQLADRHGISAAAVTGAVQKLETCGMVERTISSDDNRFRDLKLTQLGKETAEMTRRWFIGADQAMFRGVTEEELDGFVAVMEKMQRNLHAMQSGEIEVQPLSKAELCELHEGGKP